MKVIKKNLKKGFTLIELMVVIAIIGILATTLAPKLREQLAKAKDAKAIALLGTVRTATSVMLIDDSVSDNPGNLKLTWTGLETEMDLSKAGLVEYGTGGINVGGSRSKGTPAVSGGAAAIPSTLKYNGIVTIQNKAATPVTLTDGTGIVVQDASELHLKEDANTNPYSTENKEWASY